MDLKIIAAVSAMLHACAPVQAHQVKHKGLQIVHPWAYESGAYESGAHESGAHESGPHQEGIAATTVADVFMTIRNIGRTPDRLISATTPRAAQAIMVPGIQPGFGIEPGRELKLNGANGQIRLLGLTKPLYVHDNFPLTLIFEKAGRIEVEVHIEEARVEGHRKQ